MKPYLLGIRSDIHIIDLEETVAALRRALNVIRGIVHKEGIVLFVNARVEFEDLVRRMAYDCGEYFVTRRWVPGLMSNPCVSAARSVPVHRSPASRVAGVARAILKKARLPDLIVFMSMPMDKIAMREAVAAHIPTIGICDSDCDPTLVDYVVPGNDDSLRAIRLYCKLFHNAVIEAKTKRQLNLPL